MDNFKLFIPALIWVLIIFILSAYPGNQVPKIPIWQFDKWVHSFIYAVLSFLLLIPFYRQYTKGNTRFKLGGIIILFGVFYGGLMEILQHYIFINRSGNWYDFTANTIGAILGVLLFPFMVKWIPKNKWMKSK